jgi:peptide/nickel transport system permease protein
VHGIADGIIQALVLVSYAIPTFWLGLMGIVLFSARLGWLPSGGLYTIGADRTGLAHLLDVAHHLLLPALTLATFYLAVYTKVVRTAMLELAGADFVRTAHALGIGELRVMLRHAFPNALLPLITLIGYQVGSLLSGAVLVESVFSWPGLGRLDFESILARDFNLLLGILFLSSVLVTLVNVVIDFVYVLADPRLEAGARGS